MLCCAGTDPRVRLEPTATHPRLVAAGLVGGGWYATQVVAAFDGTQGVPRDDAARFLRAAPLPDGTHDQRCTTGQWMSISYELDIRAPRETAEAWLRASYPGTELRGDRASADVCAHPEPRRALCGPAGPGVMAVSARSGHRAGSR